MTKPESKLPNNFVAEWFGHRMFPTVTGGQQALQDQKARRCPFLSDVKREDTPCIKRTASRGVCTISSPSNGPRQDWLVCPYRVFSPTLMGPIVCRLFDVAVGATSWTYAAPTLSDDAVRKEIEARLTAGDRVFVYFDEKVGGEISLSGSDKSPEMSFDVTLVELVREQGAVALSKFAIIEVQTIDFHGSYGAAVKALEQALDLHEADFATQVQAHPEWAGRKIEGPNIANVVKRTFWQMLFKFQFGTVPQCAGTALAIPRAVWDSWQPFLGKPTLTQAADGTSRLEAPLASLPEKIPAWIYVFEADASSKTSPNPIVIQQVIGTSAEALDHHALTEAPANAKALLLSDIGIYATLRARLKNYWPQLVGAAPSKPNLTKS